MFIHTLLLASKSLRPIIATPSIRAMSTKPSLGLDIDLCKKCLKGANAVCFDVDSTVIDEEGIDVLAEYLGKGPAVSDWTAKAMGGGVKFEDALAASK